jgi:hypothetical protein
LNASKEEFKAAAKTRPERWIIVENAEWVKTVDGYQLVASSSRPDEER